MALVMKNFVYAKTRTMFQLSSYVIENEVESGNGLDKSEALIKRATWTSQEKVYTQAVDLAFSGYNTFNTNGLRLWRALPSYEKH